MAINDLGHRSLVEQDRRRYIEGWRKILVAWAKGWHIAQVIGRVAVKVALAIGDGKESAGLARR